MFHRRLLLILSLAAIATLATVAPAQADVYRWVDAQGRVHYSDLPVDGAVLVKSSTRSPTANRSASTPLTASERVATSNANIGEQLETDTAARAVQSDLARKRTEQCKSATERYERSITARRLYREGEKGAPRIFLSDAEIAQARVEARRERDATCGPAAATR